MTEVAVRIATSADAPLIASLFREQDSEKFDAADRDVASAIAGWMDAHASHICALAFVDDDIIGMAWLAIVDRVPRPDNFERRSGDIQSVYVRSDFRRLGAGTAMMAALDRVAQERGLAHQSVHSSTAGIPLYESVGFALTPKLLRKDPPNES